MKKLYNLAETAKIIGVTSTTLCNWVKNGNALPAYSTHGFKPKHEFNLKEVNRLKERKNANTIHWS